MEQETLSKIFCYDIDELDTLFDSLENLDLSIDKLLSTETVAPCRLQQSEELSSAIENIHQFKQKEPKQQQIRSGVTPISCDICGRFLSGTYNLRIHKMQHNKEFRYDCPQCGKKFRQRNKMENHRVIHTAIKPHICDICGKGYRSHDYLIIHRRLHVNPDIKHYKCKLCMVTFNSIHSRRAHIQKEHEKEIALNQEYTCPIALCARKFSVKCHLLTHMKRHTENRQYKCELCVKSFYNQAHLQSHRMTHKHLKEFSCDICSARFRRKYNLDQHKKIHSPIKTYACTTCNRSFAQKAGLSVHERKNVCLKNNIHI